MNERRRLGSVNVPGEDAERVQRLHTKCRIELAFALNEARALLTVAHVIEATVAPLAWEASPKRLRTVTRNVRQNAPLLVERLVNVCGKLDRLLLLAETDEAARGVAVPSGAREEEDQRH